MPFRTFLLLSAILLATSLAVQTPIRVRAEQSSNGLISLPVRIVEVPPQSASEALNAEMSSKREAANLTAQQSVAKSTQSIVSLTLAQFILALLGTVALVYSLYLTRASLKLATASNRNTRDALDNDHQNAQRAMRAYVGLTDVALVVPSQLQLEIPDGAAPDVFLSIKFKNYGQTPATDVMSFCYFVTLSELVRLYEQFFESHITDKQIIEKPVRTAISRFILNGGQEHESKIAIRPYIERKALMDADSGLLDAYIFGDIYFTDCFRQSWKLSFCYLHERGTGIFVPHEHFNKLEPCAHIYAGAR